MRIITCGGVCLPKELVVEEVVGEVELQKQIIMSAKDVSDIVSTRYQEGTNKVHTNTLPASYQQGLLGRQDWQERLCRQACSVGRRVDG